MRKLVWPLFALALATFLGAGAHAVDFLSSGYGNDSYQSQLSYDSFNLSVRKRMETMRIGSVGQSFGTRRFNTASMFSSDEALAMAPSSRYDAGNNSYRRRQLDCVYYSGFTVWGDLYQTWSRQRDRGDDDGYKSRVFGPAVGFDWTSGPVTLGIATTYNWGKIKSRDFHHDRKTRTWGLEAYGQYNSDLFYVNATLGYGHTTFRSDRNISWNHSDRYSSNAVNLDGEFGWKFNFGGLQVTPHAGFRYFHDRRGSINEGGANFDIHASTRNYHTFELPLGVDVGYEINTGGMIFVPRARFGWTPELSRKRGGASGTYRVGGNTFRYSDNTARRNRHQFNVGLGLEAKITKTLSAHIDYNCNFRSRLYEHHWNLGMGFSF